MINIILAGNIAAEAAHRLIQNEKPALSCRFSDRFIRLTDEMTGKLKVSRDSIMESIASSGIEILDDDIMELSDMGIFGGLWQFLEKSGNGAEIVLDKIPVRQEIIEICEQLDVNPYTHPSQGSWLIRSDKAYELSDYLNMKGIPASIIGSENNTKDRVIINQDEVRYLTPISRLLSDEQGKGKR